MVYSMAPRKLTIIVLDRIFRTDSYADRLLDASFAKYRLSGRDRALASEIVYGTLRWKKWLDYVLSRAYHKDWSNVPERIKYILETGLYQILFMDKIPEHAAVNESVKIATREKGKMWGGIVNGMLREIIRYPDLLQEPSVAENPVRSIAIRWSHPEWLVERWIDAWGLDRTLSICKANNMRPRIGVRVNRIRTDREGVSDILRKQGVEAEPSPLLDDFLIADKGGVLLRSPEFRRGLISVQDESAGLVALLMNPKPGECIVDMAAAPGGKAMYMAELAGDRLYILAADIHSARVRMVRENQKRLGLKSIHPVVADGRSLPVRRVDKVLVDAPCSGLGVLRRRGELRWRRQPEDIPRMVEIQTALLNAGAEMVRKEGVLVYSTCTVLHEENHGVIDEFLRSHPDFIVEDARRFVDAKVVSNRGFIETWTDRHGVDGSFAVRLRRIE